MILDVRKSLGARLAVMICGLLLANSIFLMAYFPGRMEGYSRRWAERRAVGMAVVLAGAVQPGLEFDDETNVRELLAGAGRASEVIYAAVRRADGTTLSSWHGERLPPPEAIPTGGEPAVVFARDRVSVDVALKGKGGTAGTLTIGFSLGELEKDKRDNLLAVGLVSLITFGIGLMLAFTIGNAVAWPIRVMTRRANRIAAGDLSGNEAPLARSDELGEMASAFHRMVNEQRTVVQQIASTSAQLARTAAQIYSAAQDQERAAERESDGIRQVTGTAQSLLDSAADIAEAARGVLANAERTKETTDISSRRIAELSTHTARIAELLEVIRDIADRSDLLALNASLEATRAGEAGRGFAMVAGEMRRLAERVTASVQDVKSLLADVSTSGASSVAATEEGKRLAESTTDSARQITHVTQTQRAATERLSGNTSQIAAVLLEAVSLSHQTRASAQQLKQQSEQLEQVIGRFKLGQ